MTHLARSVTETTINYDQPNSPNVYPISSVIREGSCDNSIALMHNL